MSQFRVQHAVVARDGPCQRVPRGARDDMKSALRGNQRPMRAPDSISAMTTSIHVANAIQCPDPLLLTASTYDQQPTKQKCPRELTPERHPRHRSGRNATRRSVAVRRNTHSRRSQSAIASGDEKDSLRRCAKPSSWESLRRDSCCGYVSSAIQRASVRSDAPTAPASSVDVILSVAIVPLRDSLRRDVLTMTNSSH